MRETCIRFLGWEDPLEKGMAVFLPGESPWTEEPGGLQSTGSQRVGHDWATKHSRDVKRTFVSIQYAFLLHSAFPVQYTFLFRSSKVILTMTEPATAWLQSRFSATGSLQLWPKQAHFDSCSSLWLYSLSYPFLSVKIHLSFMALVKHHLLQALSNIPSGK